MLVWYYLYISNKCFSINTSSVQAWICFALDDRSVTKLNSPFLSLVQCYLLSLTVIKMPVFLEAKSVSITLENLINYILVSPFIIFFVMKKYILNIIPILRTSAVSATKMKWKLAKCCDRKRRQNHCSELFIKSQNLGTNTKLESITQCPETERFFSSFSCNLICTAIHILTIINVWMVLF